MFDQLDKHPSPMSQLGAAFKAIMIFNLVTRINCFSLCHIHFLQLSPSPNMGRRRGSKAAHCGLRSLGGTLRFRLLAFDVARLGGCLGNLPEQNLELGAGLMEIEQNSLVLDADLLGMDTDIVFLR